MPGFAVHFLVRLCGKISYGKVIQEALAVASTARDVVEMTPPRDDNAR